MVFLSSMKKRILYRDIASNESCVLAMTDLQPDEFSALSLVFETSWQKRMQRITLENTPRERTYKPRKNSSLAEADDRLLFVLSYMKLNPLQEAHGASFGLRQPKVCVWLNHLLPVLEETLQQERVLPARTNEQLQKVIATYTTILMDATERPIRRSIDAQTQEDHYSGKKNAIPKNTSFSVRLREKFSS
jgi:Helix-turn-helix of DDE superfamily endonuclease